MMKSKLFVFIILGLMISLIGFSEAKILVAGKIYEPDHITPIANASINVQCDSNYLNTISLGDGTYAVVFDVNSCIVNVTSSTHPSPPNIIMKVVINLPNEELPGDDEDSSGGGGGGGGSGGGGGRFYLCGNGICDSGESIKTCPKDCNKTIELMTGLEEPNTEKETPENEQPNFLSKLTGAVIGVFETTNFFIVIISLIVVVVVVIITISLKKRFYKKDSQQ